MKTFTELFNQIDRTTGTNQKISHLADYFRTAEPEDAAWALFFLSGKRIPRAVNTRLIREAISTAGGYPLWMVEECYDVVGDLAETAALLLPPSDSVCPHPLHVLIETGLLPLKSKNEEEKKADLIRLWSVMSLDERFIWNKCITGNFRVGVSRGLVARALSEITGLPPATVSHRLTGTWNPSAEDYRNLLRPEGGESDPGQPYPFYLASPLDKPPQELGKVNDWIAEWKWDGIRAQFLKRRNAFLLWSRGEDLLTDRFPELHPGFQELPDGTVLDGEIMAWKEGAPLSFVELQRRMDRKKAGKKIMAEVPVVFMVYDLLELRGKDLRDQPQSERRARLEALWYSQPENPALLLSPQVISESWEELAELRGQSRSRGVEGLMLKQVDAVYESGRVRGRWWKWKIEPYTVDAVLTYAQKGHGRRAGLFSAYTFGLWDKGELVTFAKACSGLTDKEMRQVDQFVKRNTLERFGPVRRVKPELVFELACENIQRSGRHKSGIAVRFPRISRWRTDKSPEQAGRLEEIKRLL